MEENIIKVSKIRFQIISDIHLELHVEIPEIIPSAEILALCGDIGYPYSIIYNDFIKWCSENYEFTFIISGNHEYYNKKHVMQDIDARITEICNGYHNVKFLNCNSCIVSSQNLKIRVVGATLWTNLSNCYYMRYLMNDYKKITIRKEDINKRYPVMPSDTTKIFMDTVKYLESIFTSSELPIVVLTHHLPSIKCTPFDDKFTIAYASNLEYLLKMPIILWACGHTHSSINMDLNDVKIVSNQMGYPHENGETGYKEIFNIDIQELLLNKL
jgi:DNA repair exonuclease SbcCD nuclease subunit